jgi:hypothetical protein
MAELLVRKYRSSDLMHFQRVHEASGLDYQLPNLESPLFVAKYVVERNGLPTTLVAGRIEAETYLLPSGSPQEKWEDLKLLQPEYLSELWSLGIDSTYAVVPPEVERHFGKRMRILGWDSARSWTPWTRNTAV